MGLGVDEREPFVPLPPHEALRTDAKDSRGEHVPPSGWAWLTRVPFEAETPTGRKTYKAIATLHDNVNFRVIEQPAGARASVKSALEWLLTTRPNAAIAVPT